MALRIDFTMNKKRPSHFSYKIYVIKYFEILEWQDDHFLLFIYRIEMLYNIAVFDAFGLI